MGDTPLTQSMLKASLDYCPETGNFIREYQKSSRGKVGAAAGYENDRGYICIKVGGREYLAHRLAWLYVHGVWPNIIDHVNGRRNDNRIKNLRDTDKTGNRQNISVAWGTSRYVGVRWHRSNRKWLAEIQHLGKCYHLGSFDEEEAAHAVYLEAKKRLHTYWANEVHNDE